MASQAAEAFGKFLKQTREHLGLKQDQVAEVAGLEQSRISEAERGKVPSVLRAKEIATGMGMSLTELVALWEGIDLPQTENGLKKIASSSDTFSRGRDISPREITRMAGEERDPFRRGVIAAYDALNSFPRDQRPKMRERFAERVRQILGELTQEPAPARRRKNY